MAALDTSLLSGCYHVEVSGWDEDEMFFVEKSQLAGNDLTGRHISLQHKLAEGTIVFVRLLHSTAYQQSCPAAYQVEFIGNDGTRDPTSFACIQHSLAIPVCGTR
ncbi:MAG TPA: hypothetical protein VGF61_16795 [Candidatus Acidoferrum sp.]|jgi:hypothetical protein